jgi:hypothetical protein
MMVFLKILKVFYIILIYMKIINFINILLCTFNILEGTKYMPTIAQERENRAEENSSQNNMGPSLCKSPETNISTPSGYWQQYIIDVVQDQFKQFANNYFFIYPLKPQTINNTLYGYYPLLTFTQVLNSKNPIFNVVVYSINTNPNKPKEIEINILEKHVISCNVDISETKHPCLCCESSETVNLPLTNFFIASMISKWFKGESGSKEHPHLKKIKKIKKTHRD